MPPTLVLELLPHSYAVCQLDPAAPLPAWARGEFVSITRTSAELSIVCLQELVPNGIRCERDWRALKVQGPLDFSLTGVLASITVPLANAGTPIFALSTFATDYVLIKQATLVQAIAALKETGHLIEESVSPAT